MKTPILEGTWTKSETMGEFSIMITAFLFHSNGKAAYMLYRFTPFTDLLPNKPVFGHWTPSQDGAFTVEMEGDDIPFVVKPVTEDMMQVIFNGHERVFRKTMPQDYDLSGFEMRDNADHLEMINDHFNSSES